MTIRNPTQEQIAELQDTKEYLMSEIQKCDNVIAMYSKMREDLQCRLMELILAKDEDGKYILTHGYSRKRKKCPGYLL